MLYETSGHERDAIEPISLTEVRDYYTGMWRDASMAVERFGQVWRFPHNHDRTLERALLWNIIQVDNGCVATCESPTALKLPRYCDLRTRYELFAAIRAIHDGLPFTVEERNELEPIDAPWNPEFEREDLIPRADLVQRWHEWLWLDEYGRPQRDAASLGASAILAEACVRLSGSLTTLCSASTQ